MTTRETLSSLAIGDQAPDFSLPSAIDGNTYILASFSDSPVLAVLFLANHCPYVGAWEDRFVAIPRDYAGRGVAFAGICSNDVTKFPQDGPDEMRTRAEEKGYPFPYLFDKDGTVARAFGATRTPEVFVFDRERVLQYHGAIDSDYEESDDMTHYLRDALDALLAGDHVPTPETAPLGCTIKLK